MTTSITLRIICCAEPNEMQKTSAKSTVRHQSPHYYIKFIANSQEKIERSQKNSKRIKIRLYEKVAAFCRAAYNKLKDIIVNDLIA